MGFKVPLADRFWQKVDKRAPDECWLWKASLNAYGYGQLYNFETDRPEQASRISWRLHNGGIPDGLVVCHHCDVPACVNPSHLFLGTMKDNTRDMLAKHRGSKPPCRIGTAHHCAKLSEADVLAIRNDSRPHSHIGHDYGVNGATIRSIQIRKTWRHI